MLVIFYYLVFWLYFPKAIFKVKHIYSYIHKKINQIKTVKTVKNVKINYETIN